MVRIHVGQPLQRPGQFAWVERVPRYCQWRSWLERTISSPDRRAQNSIRLATFQKNLLFRGLFLRFARKLDML
jgi:hypothetical protein